MTPRRSSSSGRSGRRSSSARGSGVRRRARRGRRRGRSGGLGRVLLVSGALVGLAALGARHFDVESPDGVAADPVPWTQERVRVEVLNGGGVNGMARAATGALRDAGFDVVTFGNAPVFDPSRPSVVIDRVGRTDLAQAVATALGIDNVQSDPDPNLYVDVSVVLGQDWVGPQDDTTTDEVPEPHAPWDPRSWLAR
jgi:hypothetical protein